MVSGDPLERRLKFIQDTLADLRAELKDVNHRLDYLLENFRDQFGP